MERVASYLLISTGIVVLVLAAGYYFQSPWAIWAWPWPDGRLTYIFLASILAAIAAAIIWIGISREWGHLAAGSLNLLVTMSGITAFLVLHAGRTGQAQLLGYAAAAGVTVVLNMLILNWARRFQVPDPTPLPRPVRLSYLLFTVILLLVGAALILQTPDVMPWPLRPETSVLIGFIFFGDAFYFLYAFLRPYWQFGRAQLWSFLVYDLVLIGPLIGHLATVSPVLRTSLIVYLAVLFYSGLLAVYYLFLHRATRLWQFARSNLK
jgi:hypothetical protein